MTGSPTAGSTSVGSGATSKTDAPAVHTSEDD
jgi:hypothetical protein